MERQKSFMKIKVVKVKKSDLEPPIGTMLIDNDNYAFNRSKADGRWYTNDWSNESFLWDEITECIDEDGYELWIVSSKKHLR